MIYGLVILILIAILIAIISALPLHLAALLMGGKSSIIKVILVNLIFWLVSALITGLITSWITPLLVFLAALFIYKVAFDVGWLSAFFIWIAQFIIAAIIIVIVFLLGISVPIFATLPFSIL